MPFSLSPKDSSFYPLFTASAENLVAALRDDESSPGRGERSTSPI